MYLDLQHSWQKKQNKLSLHNMRRPIFENEAWSSGT